MTPASSDQDEVSYGAELYIGRFHQRYFRAYVYIYHERWHKCRKLQINVQTAIFWENIGKKCICKKRNRRKYDTNGNRSSALNPPWLLSPAKACWNTKLYPGNGNKNNRYHVIWLTICPEYSIILGEEVIPIKTITRIEIAWAFSNIITKTKKNGNLIQTKILWLFTERNLNYKWTLVIWLAAWLIQ